MGTKKFNYLTPKGVGRVRVRCARYITKQVTKALLFLEATLNAFFMLIVSAFKRD